VIKDSAIKDSAKKNSALLRVTNQFVKTNLKSIGQHTHGIFWASFTENAGFEL
jgi:hypothetical protein